MSKIVLFRVRNDLRGIYFNKTIKKFWGYRGIFQNPPESFLNYILTDKSQFVYLFLEIKLLFQRLIFAAKPLPRIM